MTAAHTLSPANRAYFLFGGMGTRCRELRQELGLSPDELARRDSEGLLRPSYIRELERSALGEPPPAVNLAESAAIADALGVDVRHLMFGDEVPPPHGKNKPAKKARRKASRKAKRKAKARAHA